MSERVPPDSMTASAMKQAMTAMMQPWLVGAPRPPQAQQWCRPGVQISYTHLEVRRPTP